MKMIARYLFNLLAFIMLFVFSVTFVGPVRLTRLQSDTLVGFAIHLNMRADYLYAWLMIAMHAFIAFVTLLFIRWCVRRYYHSNTRI